MFSLIKHWHFLQSTVGVVTAPLNMSCWLHACCQDLSTHRTSFAKDSVFLHNQAYVFKHNNSDRGIIKVKHFLWQSFIASSNQVDMTLAFQLIKVVPLGAYDKIGRSVHVNRICRTMRLVNSNDSFLPVKCSLYRKLGYLPCITTKQV